MDQFPELNTSRLILRKHDQEDVADLVKYANNPKISEQIINIPYPYTEKDALARLEFVRKGFSDRQRFVFVINLKGSEELIGEIGLHLDAGTNQAQFGYWVAEPFWGRGIATEAVSAILKFGFEELKLKRIYATHYPENPASGKVMQNNKMKNEGELKDHYKVGETFRNVIMYSLTSEGYKTVN